MLKYVNGNAVEMTAEEIAARHAEELAWKNRPVPTADEIDAEAINRLLLEEGSAFRALAEIQFGMIKGTIPINPAFTPAQYRAMLKSKMRSASPFRS